jgi:deazaflavin-dependent oxidoreductase (nitroreductase family)
MRNLSPHRLVQALAASRPGAWFFAPLLHHLDAAVLWLTRGRHTLSALLAGVPTVIVTVTGARSGRRRDVPLLAVHDPENPSVFALIATNWGRQPYPAWYFNLKANPQAACSFGGRRADYLAQEAQGAEYERFWNQAVHLYRGYALYRQRIRGRHIPIMIMTPAQTKRAERSTGGDEAR